MSTQLSRCCWVRKTNLRVRAIEQSEKFHVRWGDPSIISFADYSQRSASQHEPTHGSAIGASQPLDHVSGTVCQPGFASPTTTSENFVGSWSRFCSIDTAAHSDYFVFMRLLNTLNHSLTQMLQENTRSTADWRVIFGMQTYRKTDWNTQTLF